MAVKQLPTLSPIPEPPNRLVGDQERFDTMTFNSLKAQEKMVNVDLNQNVIPALNQFAVDVNASVDAAKASETLALASKNSGCIIRGLRQRRRPGKPPHPRPLRRRPRRRPLPRRMRHPLPQPLRPTHRRRRKRPATRRRASPMSGMRRKAARGWRRSTGRPRRLLRTARSP